MGSGDGGGGRGGRHGCGGRSGGGGRQQKQAYRTIMKTPLKSSIAMNVITILESYTSTFQTAPKSRFVFNCVLKMFDK